MEQVINFKIFEHNFTRLLIGATDIGCCLVEFFERRYFNDILKSVETRYNRSIVYNNDHPMLKRIEFELTEYFDGTRKGFSVPLDIKGDEFQLQVWDELCKIPYGKIVSYQDIAERLGDKNLARRVGMANGQNNIGIIVPCHRVIGKNGSLTGYGGGLSMKKKLIKLENSEIQFRKENNQRISIKNFSSKPSNSKLLHFVP